MHTETHLYLFGKNSEDLYHKELDKKELKHSSGEIGRKDQNRDHTIQIDESNDKIYVSFSDSMIHQYTIQSNKLLLDGDTSISENPEQS